MPSGCLESCGDNLVYGIEDCDDGNLNINDGCASCSVEFGWSCPIILGVSTCSPACGDSYLVGTENCDDGSTIDNDGCSSTCQQETGYLCGSLPS